MLLEIPNQDLAFITNKIIGTQCIMFPIKKREYLLNSFRTKSGIVLIHILM
jgi:hypothetical protein